MSNAEQLPPIDSQLATVNNALRFSGPAVDPTNGHRPVPLEVEMTGWQSVPDWQACNAAGPEEDSCWPVAGVEFPRELLARLTTHYAPHKIVLEGRRAAPPLLGRLVLLNGRHDLRAAGVVAHTDGVYYQNIEFDPAVEELRVVAQWSQSETPLDPDAYHINEVFPVSARKRMRDLESLALPADPSKTPGTVK